MMTDSFTESFSRVYDAGGAAPKNQQDEIRAAISFLESKQKISGFELDASIKNMIVKYGANLGIIPMFHAFKFARVSVNDSNCAAIIFPKYFDAEFAHRRFSKTAEAYFKCRVVFRYESDNKGCGGAI
jgi:hypothetical protein